MLFEVSLEWGGSVDSVCGWFRWIISQIEEERGPNEVHVRGLCACFVKRTPLY